MVYDLPILAYSCTAVPDTLGEAGVLLNRKPIAWVAELVQVLGQEASLRKRVIRAQRKRLQIYRNQELEAYLLKKLATLQAGND